MRPLAESIKTKFVKAALFNKFAFLACLFLNVFEFICFMILFYEKFKHHKRHVDLCLSTKPELANEKRRENTITTAGHFVSWLLEILIFGVIQCVLCNREDTIYNFFFGQLIQSMNYVVFPSVQAMTSQELRGHVFNLKFCKESSLCVKWKSRNEDNNSEIVELHDLQIPNGQLIDFRPKLREKTLERTVLTKSPNLPKEMLGLRCPRIRVRVH